jgi:transposase
MDQEVGQQSVQKKRLKTTASDHKDINIQADEDGSEPLRKKKSLFCRQAVCNGKFRSYKIRMYPTAAQKKELRMWYAATNRAYNSAVEVVRGMSSRASFINVRSQIVPKQSIPAKDKWVEQVPSKVRARAVKQLVDAQHINLKEKGFGRFRLRFRSFKKDPTGTIILEKAFARDNGPLHHFSSYDGSRHSGGTQKKYGLMHMAPSAFSGVEKAILIRDRHWLMDKLIEDKTLKEDAKIIWDKRTDSWYLSVLVDKEVKKKISVDGGQSSIVDPGSIVSLDPGVRSFNTFYSPDGTHGELLTGALKVAMEMCKKMDKIKSDRDKIKDQHKQSLQMLKDQGRDGLDSHGMPTIYFVHRNRLAHLDHRFHQISAQLRNWRCNAHYDAINFLIGRYNHVLIPEFQTQRMSARAERNISSKTVRSMYTMSHYMFRSKLMAKAELDENKTVRVIGEPGTSKTCGNCGYWNSDLGGKKTYRCPECKIELDRDINGARNNMIALIH